MDERNSNAKGLSMTGRALALGAVLVLLTAVNAQAQDEDEDESYVEKESAAYGELYGSGGYWWINGTDGGDDGSGGVGLTLGGHFTPNIAMDVTYEYQSYSDTSLASYSLKYVFLTDRIQPYVKVGAGIMGGRPNHAFLFMGRFDAGVTYFLNEQLALRGGASLALAKHSNQTLLGSLGVVYYFE
jgi:opacity protein-like surface antigen